MTKKRVLFQKGVFDLATLTKERCGKMRPWSKIRPIHEKILRKMMSLSFGDFTAEREVRTHLLEAIYACDEERLKGIEAPGYDKRQTLAILQRDGVYQYTKRQISERRTVLENQLLFFVPQNELEPVRKEVFQALKLGTPEVKLEELPKEYQEKLRASGLLDYAGLRF